MNRLLCKSPCTFPCSQYMKYLTKTIYPSVNNSSKIINYTRGYVTTTNIARAQAQGSSNANRPARAFQKKPTNNKKVAKSFNFHFDNQAWKFPCAPPVVLPDQTPDFTNTNHIGKVLNIPERSMHVLTQYGLLPRFLEKEFNYIGHAALLLRDSTFKLIETLRACTSTGTLQTDNKPIIIDGDNGIGKSAALLQIVTECIQQSNNSFLTPWIVVYVPNAVQWVNGSMPYASSPTSNGECYYQYKLVAQLLDTVYQMNQPIFDKLLLEAPLKIGEHQFNNKGSQKQEQEQDDQQSECHSISDVLKLAMTHPSYAHECLDHMLNILSQQTQYPVLIAIDEINVFGGETAYNSKQNIPLNSSDLAMVNSFAQFLNGIKVLKKGLFIGATSKSEHQFRNDDYVLNLVNNYKLTAMTSYTYEEVKAVAEYYKQASIYYQEFDEQFLRRLYLISSGNPRKFFSACTIRS